MFINFVSLTNLLCKYIYVFFFRYIVSDCDSIQTIVESHKFLNDTKEDAVARVLKAG